MELAGKIIAVLEPRGGVAKSSGNPWKIQEFVLETHEQYPRRMCFNVFGEDKLSAMNIQLGEELNVFFDINAREYQGRWYNDIRAWKVERVQPGAPMGAPIPDAAPFPPAGMQQTQFGAQATQSAPVDFSSNDSTDDLPF